MNSEVLVESIRLSFIWVETIVDLLYREHVPKVKSGRFVDRLKDFFSSFESKDADLTDNPYFSLSRYHSYERYFNRLIEKQSAQKELTMPWRRTGVNLFWKRYLERDTNQVKGKRGWKALVPLRKIPPFEVTSSWLPGYLNLEAFYYPHGLALVITATCRTKLTLEEAVTQSYLVRRDGKYNIYSGKNEEMESLSLDSLASRMMTELGEIAFGKISSTGKRTLTPFSLVTIINGSGVPAKKLIPEGGRVHRALEAITNWSRTWRHDQLPQLEEVSLPLRRGPLPPSGHIVYARKRGRAVWFPGLFTLPSGSIRSLSCYHRNLVLASLQAESLGSLVRETAGIIGEGANLSNSHTSCARSAAGILGRFYGGKGTYRSWSLREQIEENRLVVPINKVRKFFNMVPLF